MRCGGIQDSKPADEAIHGVVMKIKNEVHSKTNETYDHFNAHSYAHQVVAGLNYFIKIHVRPEEYIHVRVYKPLPPDHENLQVTDVQTGKTLDDPIEYF